MTEVAPLPPKRTLRSRWQKQIDTGMWVVRNWGQECLNSLHERVARVLEEAVELAQACGLTQETAERIVKHVFSRPAGNPHQELAGVGVTLLACAAAMHVDLDELEETELVRIESLPVSHFRRKHDEKAAAGIMPTRFSETVPPSSVRSTSP